MENPVHQSLQTQGGNSMFKVYIWIDGSEFDPEEFNASLDTDLRGNVRTRKQLNKNFSDQPTSYWESELIEVSSDYPEDKLTELLKRYRQSLLPVIGTKRIRIVAEIVARYENSEEVRGYFLSTDLIQCLAELRASLDIDVYVD